MFKTYKASAGSGKTTSLVGEYLAICLADTSKYRNVLAITFTNNATAEMKDRIIKTLDKFAFVPKAEWDGSTTAICQIMQKLEPSLTDDLVPVRSQELLGKILYDYPNFSLSTIDSFFQRILRAFAFELDINMNFELEITLDDLYTQTIDVLLNRISNDEPALKKRILDLIFSQMEENGRWDINQKLESTLSTIYEDEESATPLAQLSAVENLDEIINGLNKKQSETRNQLKKMAEEGAQYMDRTGLTETDFFQGKKGVFAWFHKFKPGEIQCNSYVQQSISDPVERLCVKDNANIEIHNEIVRRIKAILEIQKPFVRREALLRNTRSISILFDLKNIMDEIRERDNKFFLAETNYKLYSELKEESSDFLFEKIGSRYSYFFIDEFQDTSKLQWEDMVPLLQNMLSSGNNKVILFGDVKQAIYRFRNGDSRIFADLTNSVLTNEYFRLQPGDTKGVFKKETLLDVNYRSGEHIVQFNNTFFQALPTLSTFPADVAERYNSYYVDASQNIDAAHKSEKGLVTVRFKDETTNTREEFEDKFVYQCVKDALSRGYDYKDIAILSSGKETGLRLARMLATSPEGAIPVISSDSLLLSSSPQVSLIIATLRHILDSSDRLSCFNMLHLLTKHLHTAKDDTPALLAQLISNATDFRDVLTRYGIDYNRDEWQRLSLISIVHRIVERFKINNADPFVIALIDNVIEYSTKRVGEIGPFLDWWDEKSKNLALSSPEGINAITISTIHKSKGLQYPVVIIPKGGDKFGCATKTYWHTTTEADGIDLPCTLLNYKKGLNDIGLGDDYKEEMTMSYLDTFNLLYVAQTRPKEMLYILATIPKGEKQYPKMLKEFLDRTAADATEGCSDESRKKFAENYHRDEEDENVHYYGDRQWRKPATGENPQNHRESSIKEIHVSNFDASTLEVATAQRESIEQAIGNAVHDFLARLSNFPQNDAEIEALELGQHPFAVEIRNALHKIVDDEHLRPYFATGVNVLNEVSILRGTADKEDDTQLMYRPDRVALLKNETVVLDYKTGHPTERAREKYEEQVSGYVNLLQQMGYPNVHGELIFL